METVPDFVFVLNNLHLPWSRHGYKQGPGVFWVACSQRVGALLKHDSRSCRGIGFQPLDRVLWLLGPFGERKLPFSSPNPSSLS